MLRLLAVVALAATAAEAITPPITRMVRAPRFAEVGRSPTQVAQDVAQEIFDDLPIFNAFNKKHEISNGGRTLNQKSKSVEATPFTLNDLYAIAGTAANLLACRKTKGADFDFWAKGDIMKGVAAKHMYRLEFRPAPQTNDDPAGKDNYWMVDDHYKGKGSKASKAVNPLKDDKKHGQVKHIGEFITTRTEFDVWSQKANIMKGDEYKQIRMDIKKNGAQAIPFTVNKGKKKVEVKLNILPIQYLIRQKVGFVRTASRQKYGTDGDSHAKGAGKFINDASDLACMCKHRYGVTAQSKYSDIKKICAIKWKEVSKAVDQIFRTPGKYNALVASVGANVGLHKASAKIFDGVDGQEGVLIKAAIKLITTQMATVDTLV